MHDEDDRSGLTDRDRDLLFGPGAPQPGDAVVHFEHGLARYGGETTVEVEGIEERLHVFVYRHGGKLMLPAELGRDFWPFGAPADAVTLDRLDADDWVARRDEMVRELRRSADALVEEDRARRSRTAHAITPEAGALSRIADDFPHPLTEDQNRAVDAVLSDIAREMPMNRLLIGDVGFGKTEVALRAVAAAALAGHQVAVAAPTTVLARQHAEAMRDRLSAVGVDVVELSRLTTGAERSEALDRVATGAAKVAVGTHALLAEDVAFSDLALVVIDEEQKFGRGEKKGLRALASGLHVLSMTATPIPRSLAAAEVGLLDVSVLATAPEARHPVETTLAAPSDEALREAVAAEFARGGQAYVVCPRIDGVERVAAMLGAWDDAPRVLSAHGQMDEHDLEARMLAFRRGEADVLVSTTIIENGLDNPNANAMVVCDADLFGLTQLHQLRGRIGRADVPARMLLLTAVDMADADDPDSDDDAPRRLAVFVETTELGCGFRLARRDRDLRGFGELDGDEQSGQASRLGIGLYRHVLRRHVEDAHPSEDRAA